MVGCAGVPPRGRDMAAPRVEAVDTSAGTTLRDHFGLANPLRADSPAGTRPLTGFDIVGRRGMVHP